MHVHLGNMSILERKKEKEQTTNNRRQSIAQKTKG